MNKELLYQNKKICYRITGSGKPVVLIHGFGEDGGSPPKPSRREGLASAQSQLIEVSSTKDDSGNSMSWRVSIREFIGQK